MKILPLISIVSIAFLSACSVDKAQPENASYNYDIINNAGDVIGELELTESASGVKVSVSAEGIKPGAHGIHLHAVGNCVAPDFKSAGGHINPMGKAHGLQNPDGPDNADMENAIADENGIVAYTFLNERVSMTGAPHRPALLDEDGSALVMHKNPDDGITQPIGGAGPRIACAVIN